MSDLMTQVQQIMDEENVIAAQLAAAMRAKQAAQPGADVAVFDERAGGRYTIRVSYNTATCRYSGLLLNIRGRILDKHTDVEWADVDEAASYACGTWGEFAVGDIS